MKQARHPLSGLLEARRDILRTVQGSGGVALTLILVGLGLAAIGIAIFGSTRLKAAAAVWLAFP